MVRAHVGAPRATGSEVSWEIYDMARFAYRSGIGSEIITPTTTVKADDATSRRTTRIHLACADDDSSSWRVMARLREGEDVLLCVGMTRQEAALLAKARVSGGDAPEGTVRLVLEHWQGGKLSGRWVEVRPAKEELPRLPRREPRRSRLVRRA